MASYSQGQQHANTLTLNEINKKRREVITVYREAQKDIEKELAAWYKIIEDLSPTDNNYYAALIQAGRLEEMQKSIASIYSTASQKAGSTVKASSEMAFSNEYYRKQYVQTWFAPEAGFTMSFGMVDPYIAQTAVYGIDTVWDELKKSTLKKIEDVYGSLNNYAPKAGSITQMLIDNRSAELKKIKNAISRGLLRGATYADMIKDIKSIIGKEIIRNGAVSVSGAKASATTIIRTEGNRLINEAAYAQAREMASVYGEGVSRMMLSVLDTRTRPQSGQMDGDTVPIDKPFVYPDGSTSFYPGNTGNPAYDINDRETTVEVLDGVKPTARRGRDPITGENKVFSFVTFEEWRKLNGLKYNKSGKLV